MKTNRGIWVRVSVAVGLLLLAVYGRTYLSNHRDIPLQKPFEEFPEFIDGWRGISSPLDAKILDILKVDDYMLRKYTDREGRYIWLYVGFFKNQTEGQLVHSPKYCLPGAGWRPMKTDYISISIPELGMEIPAIKMVLQRGVEREMAIYWYRVGNTYVASEYMQKLYLFWHAMRHRRTDGALIRFNMPLIEDDPERTYTYMVGFIRKVMPILEGYIPK